MSILNPFSLFRRKQHKTTARPDFAPEFTHLSGTVTGQDGTSFACMDRIATEFALLNFAVYDAKTRRKVKNHPLYRLAHHPNDDDSRFNFFYQSVMDYFNGGVFWLKAVSAGETVALFRLSPAHVTIGRDRES